MQTFKSNSKFIAALVLGASVAACGNVPDIASRNAPFEATPPAQGVQQAGMRQAPLQAQTPLAMTVSGIKIRVPRSLRVSEANSFYPKGDIVWRGDPIGDRHAQVAAIFDSGFRAGTADMSGPTAVIIDVEVLRFHSVSEKTRYSVGGVHNIMFNLTVRRASTGEALGPTRVVEANLPALGGGTAIEADRQGQTQKVRVTDHLGQVIRHQLSLFVSA